MHICDLPRDVVELVFQNLPITSAAAAWSTCTYFRSFAKPVWMVYDLVHHADTFDSFLIQLGLLERLYDIQIEDIEYNPIRSMMYDHENALLLSMHDLIHEHLALTMTFPGCRTCRLEWWLGEFRCTDV